MRQAGRPMSNCPDSYSAAQFSETMMVGRQTVHMPPTVVASIMGAIGTRREQTSAIVESSLQKRFWCYSMHDKSHG
jgi:hypothetical protein